MALSLLLRQDRLDPVPKVPHPPLPSCQEPAPAAAGTASGNIAGMNLAHDIPNLASEPEVRKRMDAK